MVFGSASSAVTPLVTVTESIIIIPSLGGDAIPLTSFQGQLHLSPVSQWPAQPTGGDGTGSLSDSASRPLLVQSLPPSQRTEG